MTIMAFHGVSILKTKHEKAQKFDLAAITKLEIPSRIYDRSGVEIGQIINRLVLPYIWSFLPIFGPFLY